MKKLLLVFGALALALCAGCAAEPSAGERPGAGGSAESGWTDALFPDCAFSPLQTGVWDKFLVGESAACLFVLTPFNLFTEQYSGVVSLDISGCHLHRNCGVCCGLEPVVSEVNFGILCGLMTGVPGDNRGVQIGGLNLDDINTLKLVQIVGVNVADRVRAGLVNYCAAGTWLDVGLVNLGGSTVVQIGVLNRNRRAWIPWFPILNFCPPGRSGPEPTR